MGSTLLSDYLAPLVVEADDSEKDRVISSALQNLSEGKAFILGFSGKKGAGKDTMSIYLTQQLASDGFTAEQTPISAEIKNEAQDMFQSIYAWIGSSANNGSMIPISQNADMSHYLNDRDIAWHEFEKSFISKFAMTHKNFEHIMSLVYPLLKSDSSITGLSRNNEVISLLQYLGKELRQPQDILYWTRKALWRIAVNAASGVSSLVSDVRFPHDAQAVLDVSGYLVRLDISPEEQAKRLLSRDGVIVPMETLTHISETALDDFPDFNMRIDTDVSDPDYTGKRIYESWKASKRG